MPGGGGANPNRPALPAPVLAMHDRTLTSAPRLAALVLAAAVVPVPAPALQSAARSVLEGGAEAGVAYLASPEELLRLDLDGVLRGSAGERAFVGAEVVSLARGDVLYSLNAQRLLQPASNVKLFTAAAALHYLGPGYTFRTAVHGTAPVDAGGVLRGDLVLEGRGDPSLSGRFYGDSASYAFDALAETLRSRGLRRVTGDLVGDNTFFEGPELGEGWAWDVQQWWYAAQIDALSFHDNTVNVAVAPGPAVGTPARLRLVPETSYVEIVNEVRTIGGRSGQSVTVERLPGTNRVVVRGRVPVRSRGVSVPVTVHDPARFALTVFRERLLRAGIVVEGGLRLLEAEEGAPASGDGSSREGRADEERIPLAVHLSPPLREAVKVVNKRSQNFYAEQLLKTIGAEVRGSGSARNGIAAVDEFLQREVGIEGGAIYMVDGSGLSRLNLVTPHAIVQLLAYMDRHPHGREFYESLATPGEDANARRLDEPLTAGNVHAKTGTVRYVSAYSGYVTAANGERLAFAILVNNRPGKAGSVALENAVVRALARFRR